MCRWVAGLSSASWLAGQSLLAGSSRRAFRLVFSRGVVILMAPSVNQNPDTLLGDVAQAIGPDFAWIRIGQTQSQCMVQAGNLPLAPVVLPTGVHSLVEAFTRAIPVSDAKATELLYHGALTADPAFRVATEPGLQPLAGRVRDILNGVASQGHRVRAVVIDLPGGGIPGLSQSLQDLWPDLRVVPLESLGLSSPATMPSSVKTPASPYGGGPAAPAAQRPAGSAAASLNASSAASGSRGSIAGIPVGSTAPMSPVASVPGAHNSLAPTEMVVAGSAFLAWLAFLAALLAFGSALWMWAQFGSFERTLNQLSVTVSGLQSQVIPNLPGGEKNQPSNIPPPRVNLPPLPGGISWLPTWLAHPVGGWSHGRLAELAPLPGAGGAALWRGGVAIRRTGVQSADGDRLIGGSYEDAGSGGAMSDVAVPTASAQALDLVEGGAGNTPPALPPATPANPPATAPAVGVGAAPALPEALALVPPAASPVAATMSLPDVLKLASTNGLAAQAATWHMASIDATNSLPGTQFNPRWDIAGSISSESNLATTTPGLSASYLGTYASEQFDLVNKRGALNRYTKAAHLTNAAGIEAARVQTMYDAAQAYLNAVQARDNVTLQESLLRLDQRQLQTARARLAEGFASGADVNQAYGREATAREQLTGALTDEEVNELRLGAAVRVDPGSRVEPKEEDDWLAARAAELQFQPPQSLAAGRFSVVQASRVVDERLATLAVARKGMAPILRGFVGVTAIATGTNGPQPVVGATGSIPLYDGGATHAAVKAAEDAVKEARILETQALESGAADVSAAQAELRRAQQRVDLAKDAASRLLDSEQSIENRYEAGFSSMADWLAAESQYSLALHNWSDSRRALLQAQLDILRASGRLTTL